MKPFNHAEFPPKYWSQMLTKYCWAKTDGRTTGSKSLISLCKQLLLFLLNSWAVVATCFHLKKLLLNTNHEMIVFLRLVLMLNGLPEKYQHLFSSSSFPSFWAGTLICNVKCNSLKQKRGKLQKRSKIWGGWLRCDPNTQIESSFNVKQQSAFLNLPIKWRSQNSLRINQNMLKRSQNSLRKNNWNMPQRDTKFICSVSQQQIIYNCFLY